MASIIFDKSSLLQYSAVFFLYVILWLCFCFKEEEEDCRIEVEIFLNEALVLESEFLEHQSKSGRKVGETEWSMEVSLIEKVVEKAQESLEILYRWCNNSVLS